MTTVVRVGLVALLAAVAARAAGNCTDGVLNNNETQVDCGGESTGRASPRKPGSRRSLGHVAALATARARARPGARR